MTAVYHAVEERIDSRLSPCEYLKGNSFERVFTMNRLPESVDRTSQDEKEKHSDFAVVDFRRDRRHSGRVLLSSIAQRRRDPLQCERGRRRLF